MRKALFSALVAIVISVANGNWATAEEVVRLEKNLGGLRENVEVITDKFGIPHIYAKDEADAMFALGYVHARDRLWQMDFSRRAAQGRLAEVVGPDALEHDAFVRTIGLNRLADASAERVKNHPGLYRNLVAYSWGVNSYIAGKMPEELPVEFRRLDYQPGPWTVADSLSIGKAMAWDLCGSLDDLYLGTLTEKLGPAVVDELFPIDRYMEIPIVPPTEDAKEPEMGVPFDSSARRAQHGAPLQRNVESAGSRNSYVGDGNDIGQRTHTPVRVEEACLDVIRMASGEIRMFGDERIIGSNNWVIDGRKSATGRPILASDPHLGFHMPCVWYAVHIRGGDLDVVGVSLPGLPIIPIGHNRNIAWGCTNTQADGTDFFIETLNEEKTQYLHEDQWKPLKVVNETIDIRGGKPLELKIMVTAHGPIMSTEGANLAMQWIGAEPDDDSLAFYLLNHAVDYDDFAVAMQTLNAPPQNFAYADTNGMIAMWVAGLFPVRKMGLGRLPVDGASGDFDWKGFIPRAETPHSASPTQHYLASANQRPSPKDYPYYLGYEWDPGYRARRINQLLSSQESITAEQMRSFQADTYDTAAASMLPRMTAACKDKFEDGSLYAQVLDIVSKWDFVTAKEKAAPAIWWKWLDKFRDLVWRDEWAAAGLYTQGEPWGHTDMNKWQPPMEVLEKMVVEEPNSKWFDDVSTKEVETLEDIASRGLREAADDLALRYGGEASAWVWGRANRLRIEHLSNNPTLGRGGQPLSGSDLTLNARGNGGDVTGGPSWRMVVDFTDLTRTTAVFPGGQSGDPTSPHYDDLIDEWIQDKYVPVFFYPRAEEFPADQIESWLALSAPIDSMEITGSETTE
ncbi:penicillin acylase family protein [Candidatus Poribacteria bacterium]|nr:penicillin acylase family protein [Candidatus Poribacteria bacterium]